MGGDLTKSSTVQDAFGQYHVRAPSPQHKFSNTQSDASGKIPGTVTFKMDLPSLIPRPFNLELE